MLLHGPWGGVGILAQAMPSTCPYLNGVLRTYLGVLIEYWELQLRSDLYSWEFSCLSDV